MRGRAVVLSAVASLLACFAFAAPAIGAATYSPIGAFGSGGSGDGQFLDHSRIAVEASTGYVFVADTGNDRVQVLEPSGTGLQYRATIGAGVLNDPFGVVIDPDNGDVYVSDAGNDRIVRFDSTYALDTTFAPAEVGSFAADLEFDAANDQLLLADPGNDLVHRLDAAGAVVSSFDGSSSGSAFTGLRDIAIDPASGDVLVVDAGPDFFQEEPACCYLDGNSRVERFSADGSTHVATIGPVSGAGLVAVDPNNGQVIVGDVVPSAEDGYQSSFKAFDGGSLVGNFGTQLGTITGIAVDAGASDRLYSSTDRVHYQSFPDEGEESIRVFEAAAVATEPPVVTIDPVDPGGVSEFAASFAGSVDPLGAAASWSFEYAVQGSDSWTALPAGQLGPADPVTPVSGEATGLASDTTYEVRLAATNGVGTSTTSPVTFTTLFAEPPTATIDPPALSGPTSATFSGAVNPQGYPTSWRFEYSVEGSGEWRSTEAQSAGEGTSSVAAEATVGGLELNSDYLVRLVASNPAGSVTAGPESLATGAAGPQVETRGTVQRLPTKAVLRAEVDPNNAATNYHFEYGTSPGNYGTTVPVGGEAIGAGSEPVSLLESIQGLEPATTYYYRAVADNGVGDPVAGEEMSFETRSATTPGSGRGFEMVTPSQKNGGEPGSGSSLAQAAEGGGKIVYTAPSAFADSQASGLLNRYLSRRGPSGWTTESITPYSAFPPFGGKLQSETLFGAFSDDLSRAVLTAQISPPDVPAVTRAFYRWSDQPRAIEYISEPETPLPSRFEDEFADRIVGGGGNLDTVVFESRRHYVDAGSTPGTTPGYTTLYEYRGGELGLVGILPETDHGALNGQPAPYDVVAGAGGTGLNFFRASQEVSDDGSRIFFTAKLNEIINYNNPSGTAGRIYVREDGATTTWISKSQRTTPDPAGERDALYQAITPDGRYAFFSSAEKLTDDSTARLGSAFDYDELYRYDVESGELVDLIAGLGLGDVRSVLGVSDDGGTAYFVASPTASPYAGSCEDCELYVWRQNEVRKVTSRPLHPLDAALFDGSKVNRMSYTVSANGKLSFTSNSGMTDVDPSTVVNCVPPGGETTPCEQVYFYDPVGDELSCASCAPNGDPPTAKANSRSPATAATLDRGTEYRPRTLYANGSRLVFNTEQPLLPEDVNEAADVYEYDAEGGHLRLISGGNHPGDSYFQDASADGRDLFIWTRQPLVPGDIDEMADVYDARVGGGFPTSAQPVPCGGDSCQGPPGTPPDSRSPATGAFQGRGNLRAEAGGCGSFRKRAAIKLRRAKGASESKAASLRKQAKQLKKQAKRCERGNGS